MKLLLLVSLIYGAALVNSIGIKPKRHLSGAYEYGSNLGHHGYSNVGHQHYGVPQQQIQHEYHNIPNQGGHQYYGVPQQQIQHQYHNIPNQEVHQHYGVPQQQVQHQHFDVPQQVQHHTQVKVITKEVPVHVPQPYPVTVIKKVQVPYPQPYPVHITKAVPYPVEVKVPVHIPKPYPVKVTQQVPVKVPVYIKVPQPVKVEVPVPKPYPVTVTKEVKVPTPVYIKVPVYINRPQNTQQIPVNKPAIQLTNFESYGSNKPAVYETHHQTIVNKPADINYHSFDVNPSYQSFDNKPADHHYSTHQVHHEKPLDLNFETTYADLGNDCNTHNVHNLEHSTNQGYTNYYQNSGTNGYVPSKQGGMYGNIGYNTHSSEWKW